MAACIPAAQLPVAPAPQPPASTSVATAEGQAFQHNSALLQLHSHCKSHT